jgi:hypothetical protein
LRDGYDFGKFGFVLLFHGLFLSVAFYVSLLDECLQPGMQRWLLIFEFLKFLRAEEHQLHVFIPIARFVAVPADRYRTGNQASPLPIVWRPLSYPASVHIPATAWAGRININVSVCSHRMYSFSVVGLKRVIAIHQFIMEGHQLRVVCRLQSADGVSQ